MSTPLLRPKAWRIVVFFVAIFVAVAGPTVGVWMLILLGPPPYRLDRAAMVGDWRRVVNRDGVTVAVEEYDTNAAAAKAASWAFNAVTADRASRGAGTFRYRRTSTHARGEILRVENVVVLAEGPDEAAVERAVDGLPFLSPNPHSPERWLSGLLEEHLAGFLAGLGVYLVIVTVAMFKGGAWAARIPPEPGVSPVSRDEMRQRLLAVNDLNLPVHVRENARGHLIAEWKLADARWTGVLEKGGLSIAHSVKFTLGGDRHGSVPSTSRGE